MAEEKFKFLGAEYICSVTPKKGYKCINVNDARLALLCAKANLCNPYLDDVQFVGSYVTDKGTKISTIFKAVEFKLSDDSCYLKFESECGFFEIIGGF